MSDKIFKVQAGTVMTPMLLEEYIGKHKQLVNNKYEKLQNAYENKYDIYDQEKKPAWKPDNRISVNFAKYIVDTFIDRLYFTILFLTMKFFIFILKFLFYLETALFSFLFTFVLLISFIII